MSLTEKTHETTGRSKRPASFRIFVGLGNCPDDAAGGQPDALLAMRAYRRARACSRRKASRRDIEKYMVPVI